MYVRVSEATDTHGTDMLTFFTLSAFATELYTCSATLTSPTETTHIVSGFGTHEADARRAVKQAGRVLADQRAILEAALAFGESDWNASDYLAAAVNREGDADFAAPGWSLEVTACAPKPTGGAGAWSTRWQTGSEVVTRPTAADALEAARRRACFAPYQVSFMQTVAAAKDGAASLSPLRGAWDQLVQCYGQPLSALSPVAALGADSTGPAQCSAIGPDGTSVAIGFGSTAEHAAEDALRQSLLARSRSLLGEMGRVRAVDPLSGQQAAQTGLLQGIATFTGASDAVDRARLACSSVTPGPLVWKPTGKLAKNCNSASWTERPTTTVTTRDAGGFLDATCKLQVDSTLQIVRFSMGGKTGEARDALVASAFRVAGSCESACLAQSMWGAGERTPFTLAGVADRTSKQAVLDSIAAARKDRPLKGLEVLPTAQKPDDMGALFNGTTWSKLDREMSSITARPERWTQVDGHWILLLP